MICLVYRLYQPALLKRKKERSSILSLPKIPSVLKNWVSNENFQGTHHYSLWHQNQINNNTNSLKDIYPFSGKIYVVRKKERKKERKRSVYVLLTGAHHDWPVLGCTTPPVGPAAERVLQTTGGCHMGGPGRSVSSTEEATWPFQRNAAAPPAGLQAGTPDDPAPRETGEKEHKVQSVSVFSLKVKLQLPIIKTLTFSTSLYITHDTLAFCISSWIYTSLKLFITHHLKMKSLTLRGSQRNR